MLHREIIRYDGTEKDYLEKFKYTLLSKKEKARFPDDSEFKLCFTEKQVYQMNSKNKNYILERIENYGIVEDKDIYRHLDEGDYTIEHIMPQHLTPAWIHGLGDNYEKIHEKWLHRIANLTLTAYNSKYSNRTFEEKKTIKNGFEDSGLRMNTYISKKDKWTLEELEERNEYLMNRAIEIWSLPTTEFKPQKKQLDSYTLDDDASALTGRFIAKFCYKNTEQPVESWADMYLKVLQILYDEDKSIITKLAAGEENVISSYFSFYSSTFKKSEEIKDGIYVERNASTQSKVSILNKIFKLYEIDSTDLVFYLRDENENAAAELGTKDEFRRKYWSYALNVIKESFGENNPFSNVYTSKASWIGGAIGISGFSILCVATSRSVRVECCLSKPQKEENKKVFDRLIQYKKKIEEDCGVALVWKRGDDIKSSRIFYELNGTNIENETDWRQMANFHAKWSKKFYDVIIPYLK